MKHHVAGFKLNRSPSHRQALYKNLITALLTHGRITTTLTKAKAVQGQVDRLVIKAKQGQIIHRRQIDQVLNNRLVVNRLVDEIAPAVGKRSSGFTRIIKLQPRRGDASLMARLEFVDTVPGTTAVVKKPKKPPIKATKKASNKKTPTKSATVSTKDRDVAAPEIKPQPAMKPGILRRKSGER